MRNEVYNLMKEFNSMFMDNEIVKGFPLDVLEIENGYEIIADIPGVSKENVSITFEDGMLTIEAVPNKNEGKKYFIKERNSYKLKRVISFGDIEEEAITAKLENGVLMVKLLVKKPEVKEPKKINIE